jgi:predicted dehydrogenase
LGGATPLLYAGDEPIKLNVPEVTESVAGQFLEAVEHGHEPDITGRDGLAGVAVFTAAYESARTGRPVTVEL